MTDERISEVAAIEADPQLRAEMAAARLASTIGSLMDRVAEATPVLHKDIARAMGVTAGRVSQILSGDGNVRIATLGRFLDAAGYDLELTARPKSGVGEPIVLPKAPRKRRTLKPSIPDVQPTPSPVSAKRVVDARTLGFEFVRHESLHVIVDSAHDIFPSPDTPARLGSRRTTWKSDR